MKNDEPEYAPAWEKIWARYDAARAKIAAMSDAELTAFEEETASQCRLPAPDEWSPWEWRELAREAMRAKEISKVGLKRSPESGR